MVEPAAGLAFGLVWLPATRLALYLQKRPFMRGHKDYSQSATPWMRRVLPGV